MSAADYIALRAEVWQTPDGAMTHILSAADLGGGAILVSMGNGFSCYYADLASHGYTRVSP